MDTDKVFEKIKKLMAKAKSHREKAALARDKSTACGPYTKGSVYHRARALKHMRTILAINKEINVLYNSLAD